MQEDLTSFWDEYARIQARADRNTTVDGYSWGLEARLNSLLEKPVPQSAAETCRLEHISSSAARCERSRLQQLQQYYSEHFTEPVSPGPQLVARDALQRIMAKVTERQWAIFLALGSDHDYSDIAAEHNISAGAARAQVFRLRLHLAEFRPAA